MTDITECFRIAESLESKWDSYDAATRAACAIMIDVGHLEGSGKFDGADDEAIDEIISNWAGFIRYALKQEGIES